MSFFRRLIFLHYLLFAALIFLNSCGSSDADFPNNPGGEDQSPPVAPGDFTAVAISRTEVRLTWSDRSNNETGFHIFESVDNDTSFELIEQVGVDVETTVLYGKSREQDYYYKICAVNEYGSSNFSNISEVSGGALLLTIDTGDSPVLAVAYDPLGDYVVAGCGDFRVRRYSAESGSLIQSSQLHERAVLSVACSPDGRYVASGSQDSTARVRVWDTMEEIVKWTYSDDRMGNVKQVEYNEDGDYLAGLCGNVWIWDAANGDLIDVVGNDNVLSFAFISDSRDLILATNYGLELWQIDGADSALVRYRTSTGNDISVSPDRQYIASTHDKAVLLWKVSGAGEGMSFTFVEPENLSDSDWHTDVVSAVDFSSDGDYLASGDLDGKIKIWRVENFSLETTLDAHDRYAYCLDYSKEGNYLVSGGGEGQVKIWAMFF